jgi:hypothetical protein
VTRAEAHATQPDQVGRQGAGAEPSVSSALVHLVAGSQGVITKRIDLALLEGRELLSHTLEGAALVGAGTLLAVAAWLAGAAGFTLVVIPVANPVVRLVVFGLLNGGVAAGLVGLGMRRGRQQRSARPNGSGLSRPPEPRSRNEPGMDSKQGTSCGPHSVC